MPTQIDFLLKPMFRCRKSITKILVTGMRFSFACHPMVFSLMCRYSRSIWSTSVREQVSAKRCGHAKIGTPIPTI